ncbi:DUF4885 family protein [Bacillus haynesii]|uniref:DUF4885 family protein n=1 Tax=Bacillus haynesii TaxID=1925021 RepID=UPI0015949F08|nr:DUF4885 family protein [Bacillus haynesii]NVB35332.1 DUF4885 family protein [Bacillus licheniformis]MCY7778845.1 DUF4885 domain-containing protein [Bacillus haynesii]MEC0672359.1 DUF4885 family protein [Bacillus haynesii]MEC1419962.1 DUF4885 family protein [Bacillus haynesii]MEC1468208.1 DUF4885 family protein [Bacillus haynesii]
MNIRDRVKLSLYSEQLMKPAAAEMPAKTRGSRRMPASQTDTLSISKQAEAAQKNAPSLRSQMNGVQFEIYNLYVDRQRLNSQIDETLRESGISLSESEHLTLHVDGNNWITVEGIEDEQKRTRIEDVLNDSDKRFGARLLSHAELIGEQNGTPLDKEAYEKWHVNEFLKAIAGLSLADVSLDEKGELEGGNEKLIRVIESAKDPKSDLEKSFQNMLKKLKNVLAKGPDTIADRSASFGYAGGTLIDLNVSKGFSAGQLNDWLDDPFLKEVLLNNF